MLGCQVSLLFLRFKQIISNDTQSHEVDGKIPGQKRNCKIVGESYAI